MVIEMTVKLAMPLFIAGGPASYLLTTQDMKLQTSMPIGEDPDLDEMVLDEMHETGDRQVYFRAELADRELSLCELVNLRPDQQF
jgi:hypothetical protein